MRRSSFLAVGLFVAAFFAVATLAQSVAAQATATGKIGLIDTGAFFDDKPGAGIPKLKNAVNSVNAEFKSVNDELTTLGTQYQQKVDEYNKLKGASVPANENDLEAKASAITDMQTTIKRKQEDAKAKYDRRMAQVVDPINQDIVKALNDYAKQKGFAVILDGAKLEQSGVLLGFDDKYDVTKDFITFYNARPGTTTGATATAAPPAGVPAKRP